MSEQLAPVINDLNRPYWEAAQTGDLLLPHCAATGQPFWPPSPVSPYSSGREMVWRQVSPLGEVAACCVYRRTFLKILDQYKPYGIVLVELAGGVRLQAFAHGENTGLVKGAQVRLSFEDVFHSHLPVLTARKETA